MKKIFTVLLFFIPSILFTQIDSLKGNIKSIREKLIFLDSTKQNIKLFSTEGDYGHYGFSSPEFTINRFNSAWYHTTWVHYINYLRNYDSAKNLLNESWFYKNDDILEKLNYEYDERNNLIRQKAMYDDTTFFVKSYYYNDSNLLLTTMEYSTYKPINYDFTTYLYNENKKLIEEKYFYQYGEGNGLKYVYTNTGKLKEKIMHTPYIWLSNGGKSTIQKWDVIGNDQLREEYIYDSTDKLIKIKYYLNDYNNQNKAALHRVVAYRYNNHNLKIGEYYTSAGDTVGAFRTYEYNKDKLIKKERFISAKNNSLLTEIEYLYDKNKNIVRVLYTGAGKTSAITYNYKFDINDNWIEQLKTIDGKQLYLRKRELVYY